MSEAARSRWPAARFEPQLTRQGPVDVASEDPLAELARLVGHDDSSRNAFRNSPDANPEPQKLNAGYPRFSEGHEPEIEHGPAQPNGRVFADDAHEISLGLRPSSHASDGSESEQHGTGYEAEPHHDGHQSHQEHPAYDAAPSLDGAHQSYATAPLTPDLWAEMGESAGHHADGEAQAHANESASYARSPRRPLIVLASVLVLTGGGLAATFLARSGAHSLTQAGAAPTIMAAAGPNKIKPAESGATAASNDADSALLNKNDASAPGPTKVVNSQEQPIDLTQLPKAASADGRSGSANASSAGSASPFPEPKKVKTFLVRPDGTMIGSAQTGTVTTTGSVRAPARASQPQVATVADTPDPTSVGALGSAPRPSTPRTSTRPATTPKAPPASMAELASDSAPDVPSAPSKPRQPASPGAAAAQNKAKPIEVADASTADAAPASGGAFGLQLAAAPSEQDARSIFTRLQKKYPGELGSLKPTIRKADAGDKSVYRVRVGNLVQDQAKSLCARLQAGGGTCFVVHN